MKSLQIENEVCINFVQNMIKMLKHLRISSIYESTVMCKMTTKYTSKRVRNKLVLHGT